MAATISASFISQFSDNLHMLLEQKGSKLRKHVPVEIADGEKHFFERLDNFTASEVVSRLAVSNLQDPAHTRRMATVRRYEASTYLDDIDKFKLLIDPASDYTRKLANAHGKNFDEVVFSAILGTASTGADGSGTQALPSAQKIAHGGTGFTEAKFHQAMRILQTDEVDLDADELVLFANAIAIEDLFADTAFTSFDFQTRKPLADGGALMFRGVQIEHTERISDITTDSVYRGVLMTKDAVRVAMSHDLEIKAAERPDLNFALQISTYMMFGAVRMEEKRIIEIAYQ